MEGMKKELSHADAVRKSQRQTGCASEIALQRYVSTNGVQLKSISLGVWNDNASQRHAPTHPL